MSRKKIFLYAGYYEMFISDVRLGEPYSLISCHYTVESAIRAAEKAHPDDAYYFKTNLFPDERHYVLEDYIDSVGSVPTTTIEGNEFYIV